MALLKEAYEKALLNEEFGNDGVLYLYHATGNDAVSGISNKGFEREFTASNGGNMYGPGVYTTFNLSTDGQNVKGVYGNKIIKMKFVGDLTKFVVYYNDYAMRIHGTANVAEQLKRILGPKLFEKFYKETKDMGTYDIMVNSRHDKYKTSNCAYSLYDNYLRYNKAADYKIDGFIFHGGHDGYVCFCKNFKDVVPIEYSNDRGKTWKPIKKGKNFDKFVVNDVDLRWELGKMGVRLNQFKFIPFYFTNGYARVTGMDGKYNFIWKGNYKKKIFISDVWFDDAPLTFTDRDTASVVYEGNMYVLKNDNGTFDVYSTNGNRLCYLDDLPMYTAEMNDDIDDSDEY